MGSLYIYIISWLDNALYIERDKKEAEIEIPPKVIERTLYYIYLEKQNLSQISIM